jgi:undecaprenyl-diphosphatase
VIATAQIVVGLALAIVEKTTRKTRRSRTSACVTPSSSGARRCWPSSRACRAPESRCSPPWPVGLERPAAARFSFLLSVPAVAAAGIFELPRCCALTRWAASALVLGLIAAVIASLCEHRLAAQFLRTRTTLPFVVYRVALGVLIFALLATGRL